MEKQEEAAPSKISGEVKRIIPGLINIQ